MELENISRWGFRTVAVFVVAGLIVGYFIYATNSHQQQGALIYPDDEKIVANGKKVYAENCASCHGENLEGQPNWKIRGDEGLLPAPPHNETGHTWHHTDHVLFGITKFGTAKFLGIDDFKSGMTPYEGVLSDDEIVAVLSFIKSSWPENIQRRHDQMNALNSGSD